MSVNGVSATDDVDMAECDQEKVVTMMDVLQEQQEFEEDADAVLGASDDKNCTYPKGYIKRQAIYACLTCCEDAKTDPSKRAGVCLACSLSCHENHELIELYTKRNFRCDCGNPKFNSHPCQFVPEKPDLNEDNHYDQNFSGLYCICHRPYPDPEFPVEDEMIQCIICEDWLHACHLEATVPTNEQYAEMICKGCMDKNEFLHDYSDIAVTTEAEDVDVINATNTDIRMTKDSECNGNLKKEKLSSTVETSDINEKETKNIESAEDEKTESNLSNDIKMNDENILAEVTESAEKALEGNDITNKESESPIESKEEQNKDDTSLPKDIVTEADSEAATSGKVEEPVIRTEELEGKTTDEATNDVGSINKTEINIECEVKEKCEPEKDLTEDPSEKVEESIENQLPEKEQQSEEKPDADKDITQNSIEQSNEEQSTENDQQLNKDTFQESETLEKKNESSMNAEQEENKTDDAKNIESSDLTKDNENADGLLEHKKMDTKTTEESSNETVPERNDAADMEMITEDNKENTENKTLDNNIEMSTDKEEKKIESLNDTENGNVINSDLKDTNGVSEITLEESELTTQTPDIKESKRKLSTEESLEEVTTKKPKLDDAGACLRPKGVKRRFKGATFWPSQFRQKLCTCNECISMYKDLSVLFLIDPEDTVSAYETLGKEKIDGTPASQYEKGLQALSSLDRIQQINALTEYNRMRDKLLDFLKSFKDRKEVVKEEDIKAFFAGMKPKREPDGVYFCR